MSLTKAKAEKLYKALPEDFEINIKPWSNALSTPLQAETLDQLQAQLIALRKASLDRKSFLIDLNDSESNSESKAMIEDFENIPSKMIRVFPPRAENIKLDVLDIYARGIDSARAATEIFAQAQLADERAQGKLIEFINKFQSQMVTHQESKQLKDAQKELEKFNGALSSLLVKCGVVKEKENAYKAINFVRDFLWKKDICTAACTIEKLKQNGDLMLRYAEPLTFKDPEFRKRSSQKRIDLWDHTQNQPWRVKLGEKVGSDQDHRWFINFMTAHHEELKKLSSTPMSRSTPNLANAFDCNDIVIKNKKVLSIGHHLGTAITEPIDVGDTESRQDITDLNHLQMIAKDRIEAELNAFMEKWGTFHQQGPITITKLHQTLVADQVTFTPDQKKAQKSKFNSTVIESKTNANAVIRQLFNSSVIFRNSESGEIIQQSKEDFQKQYGNTIPQGWQEVNIDLKETNHCVNMWNDVSRVRNNDMDGPRELINNAVKLFAKAKPKQDNRTTKNLDIIIDFLNSSDHSLFTPYKFRRDSVKTAVQQLTLKLRKTQKNDDPFFGLSRFQRENLALALNAAVELKCTVHETWLNSLRRHIGNFTQDYLRPFPVLGPLADMLIRSVMSIVAIVVGIPLALVNMIQIYKHLDDRTEIYRASYEGLLAETIGILEGGCMSNADRGKEIAEQRAALRKQFTEEGKILSFNDFSKDKIKFYKTYGSTQAKHDLDEMATGTSVTSDKETRGLSGVLASLFSGVFSFLSGLFAVNLMSELVETPEEQLLSEQMSALRKGRTDMTVDADSYLSELPFGIKANSHSFFSNNSNERELLESTSDQTKPLVADDNAFRNG